MGIIDNVKKKTQELLDKTDLDEKIVAKAGELKEKVKESGLEEKAKAGFETAKEKVKEAELDKKAKAGFEAAKDKAQELLDKTDLDEKIAAKAGELKDKLGGKHE